MNEYWAIVEIVYLVNAAIFAYLAAFFWRTREQTRNHARTVSTSMAALTTILCAQEFYFGLNTLMNPVKLGVASSLFPTVDSVWLLVKVLITFAGLWIVLVLRKLQEEN